MIIYSKGLTFTAEQCNITKYTLVFEYMVSKELMPKRLDKYHWCKNGSLGVRDYMYDAKTDFVILATKMFIQCHDNDSSWKNREH